MQAREPQAPVVKLLPWAVFCAAYVFTDFLSSAVPMPLLWHLPVERRFTFEVRPLTLGADFYGRVLMCLLVGGAAAGVARVALQLRWLRPGPAWLRTMTVWLVGLLLFTSGLYLYSLRVRQPIPAPLPPGYVAR